MKSKIKTFENACKLTGRNPKALPGVSKLPKSDQDYHVADHKLLVIAEALVKEYSIKNNLKKVWTPNYTDGSVKYETRFWIEEDKSHPSGFGFSRTFCDFTFAYTCVGSRFAFPTSELAIYFGEQFKKLHLKKILK